MANDVSYVTQPRIYFSKPAGVITRTSATLGSFSTAWTIPNVVVGPGQNVLLTVTGTFTDNGSTSQDKLIGIARAGSLIASWIQNGSSSLAYAPLTLSWVDENPGAGSYTYEVQGAMFGGATLNVRQSNPTTDTGGGASIFTAEVYTP